MSNSSNLSFITLPLYVVLKALCGQLQASRRWSRYYWPRAWDPPLPRILHEPSLFAGQFSFLAVNSSAFTSVSIITYSSPQHGVSKLWEGLEIKCFRLCELQTVCSLKCKSLISLWVGEPGHWGQLHPRSQWGLWEERGIWKDLYFWEKTTEHHGYSWRNAMRMSSSSRKRRGSVCTTIRWKT